MHAGECLAVYGSLMRGLPGRAGATGAMGRAADDLLDSLGVGAGLRRIGACRIPGRLFDLGDYPAMRPAESASGLVRGEIHAVLDPAVLETLDAFEGFDPRDPAGSAYRREWLRLSEPRGAEAWVYVFNRALDPAQQIGSGDWRAHLAERAASAHDPGPSGMVGDERRLRRWDS